MSVRPREAFEAAQQFSLRDALGADPTAPQLPQSTGGNLTFNLASLGKSAAPLPVAMAETPVARPIFASTGLSLRFAHAPVPESKPSVLVPAGTGHSLPNLSFTSMGHGSSKPHSIFGGQHAAAHAKEQAAVKSDVMRLTAYVDELTSRLKKTQHRLDQTEAQLTRTSQVLCHERQAADQTLVGYKQDLAQAHENETRLRTELAASKKKSSLTDSSFMASVGSALASDEQTRLQQRNLSELETKVGAMGDFKVKLEAEVAKLESLRAAALKDLNEQRTLQDEQARVAALAKEELKAAQKQLAEVNADHSSIQERLAVAKVEEATLSEALSAMRVEKAKAEAETASARSATRAMLLEHGDASGKLCEVQKRIDELEGRQESATKELEATRARAAAAEDKLATVHAAAAAGPEVPTLSPARATPEAVPAFTLDIGCSLEEEPKANEGTTAGAPVPKCGEGKGSEDEDEESNASNGEEETSPPNTGAPPPAPRKPTKRRAVISGALAPNRTLSMGLDMSNLPGAAAVRSVNAVASVLSTDAPIELTLQRVAFVGSTHAIFMDAPTAATGSAQGDQEDPTSKMVNAVVGDLKSKLTEISQQQPVWRAVAPLA